MRSIHDIVLLLNESLVIDNARILGIAQTIFRGVEKMPAIPFRDGNWEDVPIIDDQDAIKIYHKVNGLTSRTNPGQGYGRSIGSITNTYSMSMIVWLHRGKADYYADELVAVIQSLFPDHLSLSPYLLIQLFFNSAILNDVQVYNQEYLSDTYRLGPEHNLFQINYTVEATFLKGCFNNGQQYA